MALSLDREYKGVLLQDAYHRVSSITVEKSLMTFVVDICASSEFDPIMPPRVYQATYELDGLNYETQAYEHLKSLDEFNGYKNLNPD